MTVNPTPPDLQAAVPEMGRRLAAILGPLAAAVAAGFLRRPALVALIIPLWQRLMHVARRFVAAGMRRRGARVRPARTRRASTARGTRTAQARLPGGRGWLVVALGSEAACHGSQLENLLNEPEMRAMIDQMPGVGRVLRPICWMLGISRRVATSAAEIAAEAGVAVGADGCVGRRKVERPWPPAARPVTRSKPAARWPWDVSETCG